MKLALQLSCYNGARYLPHLFASLTNQTFQDWKLVVLDNASHAEDATAIREAVKLLPREKVELFRVHPNIGFAGAHAYLYKRRASDAEYVALLNDDAILEPTYLETLVQELDEHAECAAVEGIIYRWDFDKRDEPTGGKTTVLDTYGLARDRFGRIFDRGANATFDPANLPTNSFPVWGVSGCLPMYRIQAIQESTENGCIFDNRLRIYKEDVDLAWSFHHLGWTARTVPAARAYHRRSYGAKLLSLKRPTNENGYLSYRNHLWNLYTHGSSRDLITHLGILPFETGKALYWLFRSPKTLWITLRDSWRARAWLRAKRQFLRTRRAIHANGVRAVSPPPARSCDVAVIMVTHNDASEECLASLARARKASPHLSIQLIVADNLSHVDTDAIVKRHIPDATVLLRDGDHGYGRSCNRAVRDIRAKYYFILNPDTVLTQSDLFDHMIRALEAHPEAGMIGPKIFYLDGRLQETCRRFPRWYMPFIQRSSLGKTRWGKRYADSFVMSDDSHTRTRAVDWIQGSAMFLRGSFYHQLGGFDDRYWLYFEDIDLCRRTWLAGKQVLYVPKITLKHAHGKLSGKHRSMLMNLILIKEARGHIISWAQYTWKWLCRRTPNADAFLP